MKEELISIEGGLKALGVFVAYARVPVVRVVPTPPPLDSMIREAEEEVKSVFGSTEKLTEHPLVQSYRKLLWRLGVDPTKLRPSGEALARRILNGGRLPRINSVVDSGNLVSLKTLIPIGLYDLAKLTPPLRLVRAAGGEEFAPIGGRAHRVKRGTPILVDSEGTVIHIYPHRDSRASMVTMETTSLLIVAAGAPGVPENAAKGAISRLLELLAKYSGAVAEDIEVLVA